MVFWQSAQPLLPTVIYIKSVNLWRLVFRAEQNRSSPDWWLLCNAFPWDIVVVCLHLAQTDTWLGCLWRTCLTFHFIHLQKTNWGVMDRLDSVLMFVTKIIVNWFSINIKFYLLIRKVFSLKYSLTWIASRVILEANIQP